jgi:stringent starvation protein A
MMLISGTDCLFSQSVRIVLKEKAVECEYRFLKPGQQLEGLAELNPYMETPTLIDRDLVLYDANLICEYLDERLPHPPLTAVDPVGKAKIRLLIHRLRRDWLERVNNLGGHYDQLTEDDKNLIRDGLISISPVFREQNYLGGQEYGLADCFMAPLLWRLSILGIRLPKPATPLKEYAERLFGRLAFAQSLTEAEKSLH